MKLTERKPLIVQHCRQHLEEKLRIVDQEMAQLQESANNETKSTAGDKYETGRAMAQIEIEKSMAQAHILKEQLKTIDNAAHTGNASRIGMGSLVETDDGMFFIATSIGRINVGGIYCAVVSGEAPIALALKGKAVGETASFRGKSILIKDIY